MKRFALGLSTDRKFRRLNVAEETGLCSTLLRVLCFLASTSFLLPFHFSLHFLEANFFGQLIARTLLEGSKLLTFTGEPDIVVNANLKL